VDKQPALSQSTRRGIIAFTLTITVFGFIVLLWQLVLALMGTPSPLTIALIYPDSEAGTQLRQAAELAHAQHPLRDEVALAFFPTPRGFIEGQPVNIQHTQDIATALNIVAVIGGPNSQYAQDSLPILNEAGVAFISPLATAPQLTKSGYVPGAPGIFYPTGERTFFRTIPSDEMQGSIAAFWAGEQGYARVLLAYIEDDPYSAGLAGIFEANMNDFGLAQVGEYAFSLQTNVEIVTRNLVNTIRVAEPDLLYYPLLSGGRYDEVIVTLFDTFPDLTILGGDGMTYETYAVPNPAQITGLYATIMPADPLLLESAASFVAAYTAAYNRSPSVFTLTTYDAVVAALTAIENAERPITRATVLDSLRSLENIQGAQGNWRFDALGDIDKLAIRVVQFDNGNWVTIQTID
jgi:branched-chain amino acid transport system substrate-binding protein